MRLSVIGFGASPLGNEFGEADADEGARAVHFAIDRGINFFDVSPYYGRTLAEESAGSPVRPPLRALAARLAGVSAPAPRRRGFALRRS